MSRSLSAARSGQVFILVLGTAMVVSTLAISAMAIQRLQQRAMLGYVDAAQARLNAQAALRIGLERIASNPQWRLDFSDGMWISETSLGGGTYSLIANDPSDNDLSDSDQDPLVLRGEGTKGKSKQFVEVTLAPETSGLHCLAANLWAGGDVSLVGATVFAEGGIGAQQNLSATSSLVSSSVEAGGSISGGSFQQDTTANAPPRELPTVAALDEYKSRGTWIHISSIPFESPNLLANTNFEQGLEPWQAFNCDVTSSNSESHGALASMLVSDRLSDEAGPAYDWTSVVQGYGSGTTYRIQGWVRTDGQSTEGQWVLELQNEDNTLFRFEGGLAPLGTSWQLLAAEMAPTWSGRIIEARLRLVSFGDGGTADLYLDDVSARRVSPHRTIQRQFLGPNHNPYTGETQPEGIYLIDCQGERVDIESSRIVGTLVLIQPGPGSAMNGKPVFWQPAVRHFPALLVEGDFLLNPSLAALSEAELLENFNPPGNGDVLYGEDTDQVDLYPSRLDGLVFVTGELRIEGQTKVRGPVVCGGDVLIQDTLYLQRDAMFEMDPPPGFARHSMQPVRHSLRRAIR